MAFPETIIHEAHNFTLRQATVLVGVPWICGGIWIWIMLFLMAYTTRSRIECRLSFRMMLLRCVSTVLVLKFRIEATSLELFPSARSCVTSRSRAVSVGKFGGSFWDMACPLSRKPANTRSFTLGVKNMRLLC